mmetsp:Transcript_9246/g.23419  ORF Transcript_9246/g.23419 Transcript_9246/m.23419 type:complete len:219 (+) Transcript_9246:619-1275(+)
MLCTMGSMLLRSWPKSTGGGGPSTCWSAYWSGSSSCGPIICSAILCMAGDCASWEAIWMMPSPPGPFSIDISAEPMSPPPGLAPDAAMLVAGPLGASAAGGATAGRAPRPGAGSPEAPRPARAGRPGPSPLPPPTEAGGRAVPGPWARLPDAPLPGKAELGSGWLARGSERAWGSAPLAGDQAETGVTGVGTGGDRPREEECPAWDCGGSAAGIPVPA